MSVHPVAAACLSAAVVVVLSACSSGGDGGASGVTVPSAGASASEAACPSAERCYDFADGSDGWPEVSDDQHYAGHDTYLHGSYRVGVREPGSWSMTAPLRISDLSPDYGVKVDVDATPGRSFVPGAAWGATCWTRDLGQGRISGFGAYVQSDVLVVGIYDQQTGAFDALKKEPHPGLSKAGQKSHLTLRCVQDSSSGSAVARISAQVDGSTTASVAYDHGVGHADWSVADGLGLVAAGQGADVFYDHVVVTGQ